MVQRYAVGSEQREGVEIFSLSEGEDVRASIVPEWGNNCFAFSVPAPILEPVAFEDFRQRPTSYGIPILFPFPNRIRQGVFHFRGQRYAVNPNRHGFVRDKRWVVMDSGASDEQGAWLTSSIDAGNYRGKILQQFPFPFRLQVTYCLKNSTLTMDTEVTNTGESGMPIGFGIHPYFHRPARGTLQVPAEKYWELVDSIPTGNLIDVKADYDLREPKDLASLSLDDIFTDFTPTADGTVRCALTDEIVKQQIMVEFAAEQFPNVVIYVPPPPRNAVCIEPYSCPTDAFNLQDRGVAANVLVLEPGQTAKFKISIRASGRPAMVSAAGRVEI